MIFLTGTIYNGKYEQTGNDTYRNTDFTGNFRW